MDFFAWTPIWALAHLFKRKSLIQLRLLPYTILEYNHKCLCEKNRKQKESDKGLRFSNNSILSRDVLSLPREGKGGQGAPRPCQIQSLVGRQIPTESDMGKTNQDIISSIMTLRHLVYPRGSLVITNLSNQNTAKSILVIKIQPIFRCYNFSFETLDTWKSSFRHSSIFDHWKLTLNRVSTN